jgi:hypothetical protein
MTSFNSWLPWRCMLQSLSITVFYW